MKMMISMMTMTRNRSALALLAVLAASPAAAQDSIPATRWKTVLTADDGTTVAIDSATIDRAGDSIFFVRTAVRFAAPATLSTGETVDREIDAEELDCGGGRARGSYSELWIGEKRVKGLELANSWATVPTDRRPLFDVRCAWLLGGFAARLPRTYDINAVEEMPELVNRRTVINAIEREYPPTLRAMGAVGTVTLRMRLLEDGTVDRASVAIAESSGLQFDDAARRVVYLMRFRPARIRGRAVKVWVTLPVVFNLGPVATSSTSPGAYPARP